MFVLTTDARGLVTCFHLHAASRFLTDVKKLVFDGRGGREEEKEIRFAKKRAASLLSVVLAASMGETSPWRGAQVGRLHMSLADCRQVSGSPDNRRVHLVFVSFLLVHHIVIISTTANRVHFCKGRV